MGNEVGEIEEGYCRDFCWLYSLILLRNFISTWRWCPKVFETPIMMIGPQIQGDYGAQVAGSFPLDSSVSSGSVCSLPHRPGWSNDQWKGAERCYMTSDTTFQKTVIPLEIFSLPASLCPSFSASRDLLQRFECVFYNLHAGDWDWTTILYSFKSQIDFLLNGKFPTWCFYYSGFSDLWVVIFMSGRQQEKKKTKLKDPLRCFYMPHMGMGDTVSWTSYWSDLTVLPNPKKFYNTQGTE